MLRRIIILIVGIITYPGLVFYNRLSINGMEKLKALPRQNVLFVSNHQTYFADVITFIHIFCAAKWGNTKRLGIPLYLFAPFLKFCFVAADTTMKSNFLARIFTKAGGITVKRTWVQNSAESRTSINPGDTRNILQALKNNWVITFPQGTTKAFAPGRKGTAYIIKQANPVVVPVVISGFSRAFDKKGLKLMRRGTKLTVTFKDPIQFAPDAALDTILADVMDAIEQSKRFMPAAMQNELQPLAANQMADKH